MKVFIAIAVLAFIAGVFSDLSALSPEQQTKVEQITKECMIEQTLNEMELSMLMRADFSAPTPAMKCYALCFFSKAGFFKDGMVQVDYVSQMLAGKMSNEKINEVQTKCNVAINNCDNALGVLQCYQKESSGIWLMLI